MEIDPPRMISWEITGKCNLYCAYCYTASPTNKKELTTKECIRLLKEIREANAFGVVFSGGEPFLRKDILDILKYSSKIGLVSWVITNGMVISEKNLKKLSKIRNLTLMISLETSDPFLEERIRPGVSFDKVIKTIKYVKKSGLPFCIGTTITRCNYKNLDSLINFCNGLEVPRIRFLRYIPVGRTSKEIEITPEKLDMIVERLKRKKGSVYLDLDDFKSSLCIAGKTECAITSSGDVLPCAFFRQFVAGNVRNQKFSEIWEKSKIMNEFRNFNIEKLQGVCSVCKKRSICRGGCRIFAYVKHGSIYAENPLCEKIRKKI